MWISKGKYERLIDRIEKLEKAVTQPEEVMYGKFRSDFFIPVKLENEWIDSPCHFHLGERITVKALVCKIADHLGIIRTDAKSASWDFPATKAKK